MKQVIYNRDLGGGMGGMEKRGERGGGILQVLDNLYKKKKINIMIKKKEKQNIG